MRVGKAHNNISSTYNFVTKRISYAHQVILLQITQSMLYVHYYLKIRAVIKTHHLMS